MNSNSEIQLVLKGITTRTEWAEMKNQIYFDFINDNHFEELKTNEILTERLRLANEIDPLIGKYYSLKWVRENVLHMTEQEIKDVDQEIAAEREASDEEGNIGPVEYDSGEEESSNNQPETNEEHHAPKPISEEEKRLVESMTKFMDSMTSSYIEDDASYVEDDDE